MRPTRIVDLSKYSWNLPADIRGFLTNPAAASYVAAQVLGVTKPTVKLSLTAGSRWNLSPAYMKGFGREESEVAALGKLLDTYTHCCLVQVCEGPVWNIWEIPIDSLSGLHPTVTELVLL